MAGAGATTLIETTVRMLPVYGQLRLFRRAIDQLPFIGPVLPDPGIEFQLVHTLDVAAAIRSAVEGAGTPGRYNLAGPGSMSIARMARACGWWSVPVPGAAVVALSDVATRIPGLPPEVEWLNAFREPTLMETRKAREELGWDPDWDADATLRETVAGARESGIL